MQRITSNNTNILSTPNWKKAPEIIALSARSKNDLKKVLVELNDQIRQRPHTDAMNFWGEKTRQSFSARDNVRMLLFIESNTNNDLLTIVNHAIECLDSHSEKNWVEKSIFFGENPDKKKLAFIFPGQGSQYINMGKDIMDCFPEAHITLVRANNAFDGLDTLSKFIYPEPTKDEHEKLLNEDRLKSTDIAQPSIGAISLVMLKVLARFGVKPDATCGHSYGELSALFSAGRIGEDAFLKLSVARGKYMSQAGKGKDKGAMLAVRAPLNKIEELLKFTQLPLVLANKNSPDQGVLSGPTEAILIMRSLLKKHKIISTILPVSAAFHSSLVNDAAIPFQNAFEQFDFNESNIPVYSNTTGNPYPDSPKEAKQLLGIHLTNPVDFIHEIENMYDDGIRIFLEIGPKYILKDLIRSILKDRDIFTLAVDGSSGKRSGMIDFARALCELAAIGCPINLMQWRQY